MSPLAHKANTMTASVCNGVSTMAINIPPNAGIMFIAINQNCASSLKKIFD